MSRAWVIAVGVLACAAEVRAEPAGKVILQDLAARGVSASDAAALTTATCTALASSGSLELLCGDELRALMQWNALASGLDRCRDEACAAAGARALHAERLVTGSVAKVGGELVLSLIDAASGQVRARAEARAPSLEALHTRLEVTVRALLAPAKPPPPPTSRPTTAH